MRRRLNVRFLVALMLFTSGLAVGVHLLHGAQVRRNAEALLRQAERAEKQGDLPRSREFLERFLALRPDHTEGRAKFGLLLERDPSPLVRVKAIRVYEKALRRDPGRRDLRWRLVRLATEDRVGQFEDAEPHLEILLRDAPKEDSGEACFLLGRCREDSGRFEGEGGASELYRKAIAADPSRVAACSRLANLLRERLKDRKAADRTIEEMVRVNPRSAEAYLARAAYRKTNAQPGAESDVARALKLAPDNVDVLVAAARTARDDTSRPPALRLAQARAHLRKAVKLDPQNREIYRMLGGIELADGQPERAVNWIVAGLKTRPRDVELRWSLADLLLLSGKLDEAASEIELLRKNGVDPDLVDYLEGRLQMGRGEWSAAISTLEHVQLTLVARPATKELAKRALLLLSDCYARLGNADQRYTANRRAVAIDLDPDPLWTTARLGLAASLVALNRIDEAVEQYRLVLPKQASAGLAIARLKIFQNLHRPAQDRVWKEVGQALDAADPIEAKTPEDRRRRAEVAVLRSETYAAQGDFASARRLLEKVVQEQPDQVDLWVALAGLTEREGDSAAALTLLEKAANRLGDRIELRLARVDYWARRGGDDAAEKLAKLEGSTAGLSETDRSRLDRELAMAYRRLGQDSSARRIWARISEDFPQNLGARLALFDLAMATGDEASAEAMLGEIRRIEGEDGSLWRFGRASLLVERVRRSPGDAFPLAEARALLDQVATQRPAWARVPLARAEIDELNGNPEAAIREYLKAIVELGERSPLAISRVVRMLNDRQRFDQATLLLQTLQKEGTPISGDLQRLAANISFQSRDYGHALELAEKAVSDRSTNYRELLWLGQLKAAAKQPAEPLFRRAVALAPEAPETWISLVRYLTSTGLPEKADAVVSELERTLPADKARLPLAQCQELLGHNEEAKRLYDAALKASPDDVAILRSAVAFRLKTGRPVDAAPLLEKIGALAKDPADISWARRLLATVLAASGGKQQSLRALEILGLTGNTASERPAKVDDEELRARARVLAAQPRRSERQKAIAVLEGLVDRDQKPEDMFLLAQLYEGAGDWPKARTQMLRVLDKYERVPQFLAYYTRALLRHNRLEEARVSYGKLARVAPDWVEALEIRARLLHAEGNDHEAVALLKRFAEGGEAQVAPAGRLLEELGQYSAAEQMYRKFAAASKQPEAVLVLAAYLGRRGQTAQALDLCEKARQTCPDTLVANACVNILYDAKGDASQNDRVSRWLEAAAAREPDKISIAFDLANLRILQGKYDDAETIYKQVHDRYKGEGSSMNNLAWLLTQRGGRESEALSLINQAIELDGEMPTYLDTRALALSAQGRGEEAVRDLENAILARPSAQLYFHLALVQSARQHPEEAKEAFQKARSLGLAPKDIHPLERPRYDSLVAALDLH